ncbi:Septum site-determining protein MinC [Buchnera aphidicola (Tuberolachnus salignus)]|uniref:Probable septum site-determining protein MinC n=1 Tax=Buchnera aphidicola subsp. Tuberolachnus salignus TaxID=98804 RepID=A0A160SWK0_BUCTT|nr:septum site-determining protein MinC [Buchnera aphidicola]CUR53192.1 Septum site-determining protein MinC [Buchnera aphidicola (Tuberolachnus salignus)]
MSENSIVMKGKNFTITVIYLKNISLNCLKKKLLKIIKKSPKFFQYAPIILNISKLSYSINWKEIKNMMFSIGFLVIGVSGCNNIHVKNFLLKSGIPVLLEGKEHFYSSSPIFNYTQKISKSVKNELKTQIITNPVRSGQKIYFPNVDIIIQSNVSAGAEIISDRNVHIYGVMRGKVLAGAKGDVTSQIFCSHLCAELVSIAGEYLILENNSKKYINKMVKIFLKKKKIIIQNF